MHARMQDKHYNTQFSMTTCTFSELSQEIWFKFFLNHHINSNQTLQINVPLKCIYRAQNSKITVLQLRTAELT